MNILYSRRFFNISHCYLLPPPMSDNVHRLRLIKRNQVSLAPHKRNWCRFYPVPGLPGVVVSTKTDSRILLQIMPAFIFMNSCVSESGHDWLIRGYINMDYYRPDSLDKPDWCSICPLVLLNGFFTKSPQVYPRFDGYFHK